MTEYLKPKFTLPAGPGGDHPWPFPEKPEAPTAGATCMECGADTVRGRPHIDQRDEDAKRSRKRVCFGKVIAR